MSGLMPPSSASGAKVESGGGRTGSRFAKYFGDKTGAPPAAPVSAAATAPQPPPPSAPPVFPQTTSPPPPGKPRATQEDTESMARLMSMLHMSAAVRSTDIGVPSTC